MYAKECDPVHYPAVPSIEGGVRLSDFETIDEGLGLLMRCAELGLDRDYYDDVAKDFYMFCVKRVRFSDLVDSFLQPPQVASNDQARSAFFRVWDVTFQRSMIRANPKIVDLTERLRSMSLEELHSVWDDKEALAKDIKGVVDLIFLIMAFPSQIVVDLGELAIHLFKSFVLVEIDDNKKFKSVIFSDVYRQCTLLLRFGGNFWIIDQDKVIRFPIAIQGQDAERKVPINLSYGLKFLSETYLDNVLFVLDECKRYESVRFVLSNVFVEPFDVKLNNVGVLHGHLAFKGVRDVKLTNLRVCEGVYGVDVENVHNFLMEGSPGSEDVYGTVIKNCTTGLRINNTKQVFIRQLLVEGTTQAFDMRVELSCEIDMCEFRVKNHYAGDILMPEGKEGRFSNCKFVVQHPIVNGDARRSKEFHNGVMFVCRPIYNNSSIKVESVGPMRQTVQRNDRLTLLWNDSEKAGLKRRSAESIEESGPKKAMVINDVGEMDEVRAPVDD